MQELERFLISMEGRAFRMAQLATQNEADALDIVQDAMFKLVKLYADKTPTDWKPLFLSILESRIMDWHRKQNLRKKLFFWRKETDEYEQTEQTRISPVDLSNPEDELLSSQLEKRLLNSIAALPVQQQQCFILRAWEGLSIAETALAMNLNENSVKTHYARALSKLKEQL